MKKITKEEFIERAKQIHDNKYDYSKVEYINNRTKVCIICPEHGEFWQVAASHLRGNGCPICGFNSAANIRTNNTDWFINKAKQIHGNKYDYSKTKYIDAKTKVCIICPEHGEFWQTPLNHLNGHGCKKCSYACIGGKLKFSETKFIKRAKAIHGDKYNYSKIEYKNMRTKICIICPEHGEFWQTPNDHLRGRGCYKCRESKLEKHVCDALIENNIRYERQKKFEWLGKQSLDFYLPDYNVAIECQGEQHYRERKKNNLFGRISKIKERDIKKYNSCTEHNVGILYFANVDKIDNIEIYTKFNLFDNIEKIISYIKYKKNE